VNSPCAEQSLNSSSIIISNALIKARVISCSSLLPFGHHHDLLAASNAMSDSADCSSSINAPHEYFDPTTSGSSAPAEGVHSYREVFQPLQADETPVRVQMHDKRGEIIRRGLR